MEDGYMSFARSEAVANEVDAPSSRGPSGHVNIICVAGYIADPVNHDNGQPFASRNPVASRVALPKLRYNLCDYDKTWVSRFNQMLVDHLHKHGD